MPALELQIGMARIAIECPPELVTPIKSTVFSTVLRTISFDTHPNYSIHKEHERYLLQRGKRITHQNRNPVRIIYALEWQIVNDLLRLNRRYLQLHAAALHSNGKTVVLIGGSGTGKTSLSILLMRHGWTFMTDEFALIDVDCQTVFPFPRNLIIKPHHRRYLQLPTDLPVIHIVGDQDESQPVYYVAPTYFGACSARPGQLSKIILISAGDDAQASRTPLTEVATFEQLYQNLFNPRAFRHCLPDSLSRLLPVTQRFILHLPNPLGLTRQKQQELIETLVEPC